MRNDEIRTELIDLEFVEKIPSLSPAGVGGYPFRMKGGPGFPPPSPQGQALRGNESKRDGNDGAKGWEWLRGAQE